MPIRPESYTVGWICAIETEFVVACELLDEEHTKKDTPRLLSDQNAYHFGRIHEHNIVIACLPKGRYGTNSAALLASQMLQSFPSIRIGLMVGIGGAAPSPKHDIRLGDIVVSSPTPSHGGVVQYDFGKAVQHQEFSATGHLAAPPRVLLNALTAIHARHERKGHQIMTTIQSMIDKNKRLEKKYSRPASNLDRLYTVLYNHHAQENCDCLHVDNAAALPPEFLVSRRIRQPTEDDPAIHYGLVASANTLVKDGILRDRLIKNHDILCFEMEAAGVMNDFPCVVIRGISDYSDTHKNDLWQGFAAASAAAYAKELLEIIPGTEVQETSVPEVETRSNQADAQPNDSTDNRATEDPLEGPARNKDPYEILGVPEDASPGTIKSAYRKLMLKNHPDKFTDEAQKVKQQVIFHQLQGAYEILIDERSRERYDRLKTRMAKHTRSGEGANKMFHSQPNMSCFDPRATSMRSPYEERPTRPLYGEDPAFEEIRPRALYGERTVYEEIRPRQWDYEQSGGRPSYEMYRTRDNNDSEGFANYQRLSKEDRNKARAARESPRRLSRTSSQGSHDEGKRYHIRSSTSRKGSPASQDDAPRYIGQSSTSRRGSQASQDEAKRHHIRPSTSRRGSPVSQDEASRSHHRSRAGSQESYIEPRPYSYSSRLRTVSPQRTQSNISAAAAYISAALAKNKKDNRKGQSSDARERISASQVPPARQGNARSSSTAQADASKSATADKPRRRRRKETKKSMDTGDDAVSTMGQYGGSDSETDPDLEAFMAAGRQDIRRSETRMDDEISKRTYVRIPWPSSSDSDVDSDVEAFMASGSPNIRRGATMPYRPSNSTPVKNRPADFSSSQRQRKGGLDSDMVVEGEGSAAPVRRGIRRSETMPLAHSNQAPAKHRLIQPGLSQIQREPSGRTHNERTMLQAPAPALDNKAATSQRESAFRRVTTTPIKPNNGEVDQSGITEASSSTVPEFRRVTTSPLQPGNGVTSRIVIPGIPRTFSSIVPEFRRVTTSSLQSDKGVTSRTVTPGSPRAFSPIEPTVEPLRTNSKRSNFNSSSEADEKTHNLSSNGLEALGGRSGTRPLRSRDSETTQPRGPILTPSTASEDASAAKTRYRVTIESDDEL